jgi:hypothetical protein
MAEKTDEDIIKEVGLDNTSVEHVEETSIDADKKDSQDEDSSRKKDETILEEVEITEGNSENSSKEFNDDNKKVQKKQPKIFRILIVVISILLILLTIGLVLFFLGFFDPKEDIQAQKDKNPEEIQAQKIPEIQIDINDLDKNKINKKLNTLTKHEIMNKHELEAEEQRIKEEEEKKLAEEKRIEEEKKKKVQEEINAQYAKIEEEKKVLEEQQKQIKEEQEKFLALQEELKKELENKKTELLGELNNKKGSTQEKMNEPEVKSIENSNIDNSIEEDITENTTPSSDMQFLSFINVATIKGELYKSYLDDLQQFEKNISLCRDQKNRIEIYFGPYSSDMERKKVFDELISKGYKQAYLADLTKEEYNKRCKY